MRLRKIEPAQIAEAMPMVAALLGAGCGNTTGSDGMAERNSCEGGRICSGLLLGIEKATGLTAGQYGLSPRGTIV